MKHTEEFKSFETSIINYCSVTNPIKKESNINRGLLPKQEDSFNEIMDSLYSLYNYRTELINSLKELNCESLSIKEESTHRNIQFVDTMNTQLLLNANSNNLNDVKELKIIDLLTLLSTQNFKRYELVALLNEIEIYVFELKNHMETNPLSEGDREKYNTKLKYLYELKVSFFNLHKNLSKELYKNKTKLKNTILSSSGQNRQKFAKIRLECLNYKLIQNENFLKNITTEIDYLQNVVKQMVLSNSIKQIYNLRMDFLKKLLFDERKELKVNKTELSFWQNVINIPALKS